MAVSLIYTKSGTPYMDAYKEQAKKLLTAKENYEKGRTDRYNRAQATQNTRQANDEKKSNQEYDASGRKNYVNYMQAQKALPSELNSLGIRGGASESSLIRLGNTYSENVASNESARGTALAGIREKYAEALKGLEEEYNNDLLASQQSYDEKVANAYATARQNQITWEKEQQQKDLEYFSGVIEGLYGDTASYDKLINQIYNSNDPNKEYKIMLALKAKQTLTDKLKEEALARSGYSSGGGGGGGYYSSGGGGGGGYDVGSVAQDAVSRVTTAASRMNNSIAKARGAGNTNRNATKQAQYSKYKYWG